MRLVVRSSALAFVIAVTATFAAPPASVAADVEVPSGRLAAIKRAGIVRLGYRGDAVPFSYVEASGRPVGYSIDLCHAIVATIADDLGGRPLAVDYVRVTVDDRFARVASGDIDLECGASTITAERRRLVAFSPAIFVTGTRLAVTTGSRIRSVGDLRGRPVAAVRGTTNEAAIREIDRLRSLGLRIVAATDYAHALTLLESGEVDALAADDVLLHGLLAERARTANVRIVGETLSFEPYGIAFARDDAPLADAVSRALGGLAASREIVWLYDRWFVRPLPSGRRLGLPMSAQLRRSLEVIGLPAD